MTEHIVTSVAEEADPQAVLTFNTEDGGKVIVTVTVTVEGDARKVWTELSQLSERQAIHEVAAAMFTELTRA